MPRNKKRKPGKRQQSKRCVFPHKPMRVYYDPGKKPKDSKPPTQVK